MPAARQPVPDVLRVHVVGTELPGRAFADTRDPARPGKDPVFVGVQRGREVVDAVPADRPRVTFDIEFRVAPVAGGGVSFLGPYAQGTARDRFFYLCWGVQEGGAGFAMFRRLKVRLGHLRWARVAEAVRTGTPLAVTLRLTDAKGGPLCATPPPSHVAWDLGSGAARASR